MSYKTSNIFVLFPQGTSNDILFKGHWRKNCRNKRSGNSLTFSLLCVNLFLLCILINIFPADCLESVWISNKGSQFLTFQYFLVFLCYFFEESVRYLTHSGSLFGSLWAKHYNCTNMSRPNPMWPDHNCKTGFFFQLCAAL